MPFFPSGLYHCVQGYIMQNILLLPKQKLNKKIILDCILKVFNEARLNPYMQQTRQTQTKLTFGILVTPVILISSLLNQCCPADIPHGLQNRNVNNLPL